MLFVAANFLPVALIISDWQYGRPNGSRGGATVAQQRRPHKLNYWLARVGRATDTYGAKDLKNDGHQVDSAYTWARFVRVCKRLCVITCAVAAQLTGPVVCLSVGLSCLFVRVSVGRWHCCHRSPTSVTEISGETKELFAI